MGRDLLIAALGMAGGLFAALPLKRALRRRLPSKLVDRLAGRGLPREKRGFSGPTDWADVHSRFAIDPSYVHMSGMFLGSPVAPVARKVEEYREILDANPVLGVLDRWGYVEETRRAAAWYTGGEEADIALTGSTTMSLAIAIQGLKLGPGSEILHTAHDHFATRGVIESKAELSGASERAVSLYDEARPESATAAEMVERLETAIRPETRVLVVAWVDSKHGVKSPIAEMAKVVDQANASRDEADRIVFVVDGVHGFGIEAVDIPDLGCDFFAAGTHKWIFGPRGTGILWGNPRSHDRVTPTIPAMVGGGGWGGTMTPGGFHAFEHQWALYQAFEFLLEIGKDRIQARIHELNTQMKEGLAQLDGVRLFTPREPSMSSGIVCFAVEGMTSGQVVEHLRARHRIVASPTPYEPSLARFTPGLMNDEAEVRECIRAIAELR